VGVHGQLLGEDGTWADDAVNYSYNNRLRQQVSAGVPGSSPWVQAYEYDGAKRLTNVVSKAGAFGYGYAPGRQALVQTLNLPGGARITNAFDSLARLTGTHLRNSLGAALDNYSYIYNPAGQRTNVTRTLGDNLTCLYDNVGQLQRIIGRESMGGPSRYHERLSYGYDAVGNLNSRTNYSLEQTFNVNNLNQLTTVTRPASSQLVISGTSSGGATNVSLTGTGMPSATPALYGDGTWAYISATLANGNNSYTAIATDGYLRKDTNTVSVNLPLSSSYRYDLNGNMLSDGRRGFDYDNENQLIRVTITNSTRSDFAYDGKMRRRVRVECSWVSGAWVTNELVRYVYDGNLVVQERHFVPQSGGEVLQQVISYTRGKDLSGGLQGAGGIGGLLARSDLSTLNFQPSTCHAYYHADGNGNVTCLIDTNQVVVAKYLYEPFGNIISQTGPLADANLYRFSSKEFHAQSGLTYYLYRYYEPNVQRWLNRDPIAELGFRSVRTQRALAQSALLTIIAGPNLYTFVRNSPVLFVDYNGLEVLNYSCPANSEPTCKSPLQPNFPPPRNPKKDCEKSGGKWMSMAEHDFQGNLYKCSEHLLTSTLPGAVGLGLLMTAGGAAGGLACVAGSPPVAVGGAIAGAGIGAELATTVAMAVCSTKQCYK
jgi:RHS repeat-associated protein